MNEVHNLSLARVMQAISERGDVEHKDLVRLRKRVEQLYRIQIEKPGNLRVAPEYIAFAALSFIENGLTARQVCTLTMNIMLERARLAEAQWKELIIHVQPAASAARDD